MKYIITSSDATHWEKTRAKSLKGAKHAAMRMFGAGSIEAKIEVGELTEDGWPVTIAYRRNGRYSRWIDVC